MNCLSFARRPLSVARRRLLQGTTDYGPRTPFFRFLLLFLFSQFIIHNSAFPQQPQAQAGQEIFPVNAKFVQGFGPGYWPTAGSNLTLNLAPGTAVCSNTVRTYAGGTLTLAPSATNYVYLDPSQNCAPASNTTGFTTASIPIARVVTTSTAVSSITDVRTLFVSSGVTNPGTVTSVGITGDGIIFSPAISGSPITSSGTLAPQLLTQTPNTVLAGPGSGPAATPTFRALATADLPTTISSNTTGNAATASALASSPTQCASNNWATGVSSSGNANCSQPAFSNLGGSATTSQLPGSGATTVNGQTCTLNSTCTVNNGAAQYSVAVNGTAGAVLGGVSPSSTSGVPLVSQGSSANPVFGTVAIGGGGTGQTTAAAAFNALSPLSTEGDLSYYHSSSNTRLAIGGANTFLTSNGTDPSWGSLTGAGFGSQTANCFFAAPNGSSGNMSCRAIVAADVPTLNQSTTGNAATATALASTPTQCSGSNFATGVAASGNANCSQPAFNNLAGSLALSQTPLTTSGDLLYANSTPALARLPIGSANQFLGVSSGSPAWVQPSFSNLSGSVSTSQLPTVPVANGGTGQTSFSAGLLRSSGSALSSAELSGDCTTSGSNALTCTKTNGTSFVASATTDTTNAANITSGVFTASREPNTTVNSVSNDTNVTGAISTQNLTLGWTGQLSIARGGTGQTTASAAFNALSPLTTEGDLHYYHSSSNARLGIGSNGQCLTSNGTDPVWGSCSTGSGTVTSVGLSMPSMFSVSGSPVTGSGTLTAALATQSANLIMAGPASGNAAAPTFRSLVGADLPAPSATTLGGIESVTCTTGQFLNQISTGGAPACATPSGGGGSSGLGNGTTVIDASLQAGNDFGSKVNAAIAALPSTGGTVDARGLGGNQNMNTNCVLGSASQPVTLLLPVGTITRASGAVFKLYNGSRVIGQGGVNGPATVIQNTSDDTSTVFANATGGTLENVLISDLRIDNWGDFSIKDASGNPQTATWSTGTCFDLSNAIYLEIDRVAANCQVALKLSDSSYDPSYYHAFYNDIFVSLNPNGVAIMLGEFPNSNDFYATKFVTWGTAIFAQSAGGYVRFYGGDIEGAGAGIVINSGTNNAFHDFYFEEVGARTISPIWAVWQANWPYIQGATVNVGGTTYVCTQAGTSGSSAPSWNATYGGTTTDNTVTWMTLQYAAVVWGPSAVGNTIDGGVLFGQPEDYSSSIWTGSNYQSIPPSVAGNDGSVPTNFAAGRFTLGSSLRESSTSNLVYFYNPGAMSATSLNWTGNNGQTYGLFGRSPLITGGYVSNGGNGTTVANQLRVIGLPTPGAPTVTLHGSHPGSGSTVTYALTAHCGGGVTLQGTATSPLTNIPSVPGALISAAIGSGTMSGYTSSDVGTTVNITSDYYGAGGGIYTIDSVSGGAVTSGHVSTAGSGYLDGATGATTSTSVHGGTGLTLNLTAYDLVEISAPPAFNTNWFVGEPWSGCTYDVLKDTSGGTPSHSIALTQPLNMISPMAVQVLADVGGAVSGGGSYYASYSAPTSNTTGDAYFNANVYFQGQQAYLGTAGNNYFFDVPGNSGDMIFGYNSPKPGGTGASRLAVVDNSTDQNTMFWVNSAGTGGGSSGVFTLHNTLEDGSGNMSAANKMAASQFCVGSNCVSSLWSNPLTTLGDFLYGGASGAATRLAGNTSTTPMYLKSVGSGSAATAPALAQIQFGDIAGTLGISAGGTGQTSFSAGLLRSSGSALSSAELSGDCTTSGSNALTCTKTNGTSFVASATTDTTNAANITSGVFTAAREPNTTVNSVSNDTNVTGAISTQNLTLGWTGQLSIARGGTGQTTASAAFNALSPLSTEGDLSYYHSSSNSRLAIGGANTFLTSNGTDPSWGYLTGAGFGSQTANNFLAAPNGSSGNPSFRTLVAADLPSSITSNTSGNAATATALASTPTQCSGSNFATGVAASGNANCSQPAFNNLAGSLALSQTPLTTSGDLLYANSTPALARLPIGSANQLLGVSSGSPAWVQPSFSNLSGSATTGQLPGSGATTVNGQPCTLGSTCNVNSGAQYSVAVNGASGAQIGGITPSPTSGIALVSQGASANPVFGTVAIAGGGTGQSTASAAFNALSCLTTLGDILTGGASGACARLGGNTTTTPMYLKSVGASGAATAPTLAQIQFSDLSGSMASSQLPSGWNPVTVANGGTGQTSFSAGLLRSSGSALSSAELSGDCTTFGSNAVTCTKINGAVPVTSFSGDGTLLSNSSSTGATTATLANAGAHTVWGNNSNSPGAPGYFTLSTDLGNLSYNSGGTTTFAAAGAVNASAIVTVTHSTSTTFSPTNLVNWGSYLVEIKQDSTGGGVTFTLGTSGACSAWKVGGGGSGAITLSTAASAIDILAFTYDGTNCVANFRANFN